MGGASQPQQTFMPPRLQNLLARIASLGQSRGSSSSPASPLAGRGAFGADTTAVAPWLTAWALLLRTLWYAGLAALPVAVFTVGALQYDLLHGAYLAGLLAWLAVHTLRLKPALSAVR